MGIAFGLLILGVLGAAVLRGPWRTVSIALAVGALGLLVVVYGLVFLGGQVHKI